MINKTFLGIGAGPIQTGIFVRGAVKGGFERIVLADVDSKLVNAVKASGNISVNTAKKDNITTDNYSNIEIFNPADADDLAELKKVASGADVICTALPSTVFYRHISSWLQKAFKENPEQQRFVYTAENSTTAATELASAVGSFPATNYLDTVIGKMSKVFTIDEVDLPPLATGMRHGHLVEAFNTIYTGSAPEIDSAGIIGLHPKVDLEPFEYAKLYGHNATHLMLGLLAVGKGCRNMDEAVAHPDIMAMAETALKNECGIALCRSFANADLFFTPKVFNKYADELISRMTSKTLSDSIDRVLRDLERKLGWDDRIIGAIRMCLQQDIFPENLIVSAKIAIEKCYGNNQEKIINSLTKLWQDYPKDEVGKMINIIC